MTNQQIADKWTGEACTLDGRPAKIIGRCLPFAKVALLTSDRSPVRYYGENVMAVEFAWPTVNRIMAGSREFYS